MAKRATKKAVKGAAPAAEAEAATEAAEEQAPADDDAGLSGEGLSADDVEELLADAGDDDLQEADEGGEAAPAAEAAPTAADQPTAEAAAEATAEAPEAPPEPTPEEGGTAGEGAEEAAAAPAAEPAVEAQPTAEGAEATPVVEPTPAEPAPTAAAEAPQTEEERQAEFLQWRDETEARLAAETFNLTEEQAQEVEENLPAALPKLAARLYLQAVHGTLGAVIEALPQLVRQTTQQDARAMEARRAFFEQWPQLNTQEASDVLNSLGTSYRAANPKASQEQFIRDVGAMAMVALKFPVTPGAVPAAAANGGEAAAPPAAAAAEPPPHIPVGQGAPSPAAPAPEENVFTLLTEEVLADEG